MKDALGHGSDGRGALPNIDKNLRGPGKHTGYGGGDVFHITAIGGGRYQAVGRQSGNMFFGNGLQHISQQLTERSAGASSGAAGVAAAHGIATEHLNSQGHAWGSPEAIKDFTSAHGGPRDHAAEQRGFNSGAREISRLKKSGK